MIVNAANMAILYTAFNRAFADGLASAQAAQWPAIATKIPSATAINTYAWLGQWPKFREWIGSRQLKQISGEKYALTNKDWESSVTVERNAVADDEYGVYGPLMTAMGHAAAVYPDELVFAALAAGHTGLCYDGQPFFSASHVVTNGTYSATHSNLINGSSQPWYMLSTSGPLKPLIYQERQAPKFTGMTSADDESVFMNKEYRYGADARSVVGYAFWQMAVRSSVALTAAALDAARERMLSFTDEHGRPLGIVPDTLVVGVSNMTKAERLINSALINDGGVAVDNPYKGRFKLVFSPLLP